MNKRTKQPQMYRKPHPKRVSMGELHYFALTFRGLLHNGYLSEGLQHQVLADITAHCPTLVQAMETWFAEIGTSSAISISSLTFTYDVPLPQAFLDDHQAYEEASK